MEIDPLSTSTPPASEANVTIEEMSAPTEEIAWEHYAPIGGAEYEQANLERIKDGKIAVTKLGDSDRSITLVASLKVDPETGQAISGHEYRSEAESMQDTENAFAEYLTSTPQEQRLVIYEGDGRLFGSRDEAISKATDSGLIQHLASREGVPTVGGEPTIAEEVMTLEQLGVSREELLSLHVVRGLEGQLSGENPDFLAGYINHQAASLNIEGFHEYTEAKKQAIVADGKLDETKAQLTEKVAQILPALNALYAPALDGRALFTVGSGNVVINPEFTGSDIGETTMERLGWSGTTRINAITRLAMEMRDRTIFHRILEAYNSGKSPFVVYGGSHMVTIEPALEAYVGQTDK